MTAAGFVLTGGRSLRLGRDKGLLELAGRSMVLRTVDLLRPVAEEVLLVGAPKRYAHLNLPVLADQVADKGPLAGIVTALATSSFDWNLVLACDLPYMETRVLETLLELAAANSDNDAVVPRTTDGWQPLCAAYHRRSLPVFEQVLNSEHPKIACAFDELRVRVLSSAELAGFSLPEQVFKNMNTREDYEEAKRALGG